MKQRWNENELELSAKSPSGELLDGKVFVLADSLDAYVTEKTASIFDVLIKNGKIAAKIFLDKEPSEWPDDPTYLQLQEKATKM